MNRYLAAQGDRVPVHSVDEIIKSRRFHPSVQARLESCTARRRARSRAACEAESGIPRRRPRGGPQDDGRS